MLKRPLTDKESLPRSLGGKEGRSPTEDGKEEAMRELEIKKNFFYVINPEGRIIDCAKIYSFLHEDNIFRRITSKICKDIDKRINEGL
jgi:hypothetical protein